MPDHKSQITRFFEQGKEDGKDYMIIMQDSFDYGLYPVYSSMKGIHADVAAWRSKGDIFREVYALNAPLAPQLAERRAMRLPPVL